MPKTKVATPRLGQSLKRYVEQNASRTRCAVCLLPKNVLTEVNGAIVSRSASRPVLARWITEELKLGPITVNNLKNHVEAEHGGVR